MVIMSLLLSQPQIPWWINTPVPSTVKCRRYNAYLSGLLGGISEKITTKAHGSTHFSIKGQLNQKPMSPSLLGPQKNSEEYGRSRQLWGFLWICRWKKDPMKTWLVTLYCVPWDKLAYISKSFLPYVVPGCDCQGEISLLFIRQKWSSSLYTLKVGKCREMQWQLVNVVTHLPAHLDDMELCQPTATPVPATELPSTSSSPR